MVIVAEDGELRVTFVTVMPGPRSRSAAFRSAGKLAPYSFSSLEDGDCNANRFTPASSGVVPMRVRCASIPNSSYPPQNHLPSIVLPSRDMNRASLHSAGLLEG